MPQKPKKKNFIKAKEPGQIVTQQNAEKLMSTFIKYYKGQEIVPEDEWEEFFNCMLTNLPFSFRISENRRQSNNIYEGKPGVLGQAEVLREFMRNTMFPDISTVELDDKNFEVTPIPWYPKQLAWKCNTDYKTIAATANLKKFYDFIFQEERGNYLFKQDVVSMIPALMVAIQPNHKILEMCCSPGYQAAMLAESLHSNPRKSPDGFIVINDSEMNRSNYRWSQGASTFFTHEDAKTFPDLYTTEEHTSESKVLYDRIFLDAPTSNDGSFRKHTHLRSAWTVTQSQKNHKGLKQMLRRGVELLEYNGQLVYSTTSLNPVENEAVVAAILKEAPGSLELVDVRKRLPGLQVHSGMSKWKVMSQGFVFYDTFESSPAWFQKENEESMFCPSDDDLKIFNMEKCVRVLPHDNDTGALFVAVITKMGPLPWQQEEDEMETEVKAEPMEEGGAEGGATDDKKDKKKKSPYIKPLRCDVNICVKEIEWTTDVTDDALNTSSDVNYTHYDMAPLKISRSSIPGWFQKKLEENSAHYEDCTQDETAWADIKTRYDIKKVDPIPNMLKYVQDGKGTMLVYVLPAVKQLLKCNQTIAKKSRAQAGGLNIIQKDGASARVKPFCVWPFLPNMNKGVIHVGKDDMIEINKDNEVMISALSAPTQLHLEAIDNQGSVVFFIYEAKGKNADPKCTVIQRVEKYKAYIKNISSRANRQHNLRMFGVDPLAKATSDESAAEEDEEDNKME